MGRREELPCYSFFQDANEILWLCTSDGVWQGSEKAWTRITRTAPSPGSWPLGVYQTRDGELWVKQFDGDRSSL
jgi:ligand-binding sensor domain-containing protein